MYLPMEPQTTRPEPQFLLMDAICNALTTRMRCQATKRLQEHKHRGPPGIGSGIVSPKQPLEHGSGPPEDGHTGDLHRRPWREPLRSNCPSLRCCSSILPLMLWPGITSKIYKQRRSASRDKSTTQLWGIRFAYRSVRVHQ